MATETVTITKRLRTGKDGIKKYVYNKIYPWQLGVFGFGILEREYKYWKAQKILDPDCRNKKDKTIKERMTVRGKDYKRGKR